MFLFTAIGFQLIDAYVGYEPLAVHPFEQKVHAVVIAKFLTEGVERNTRFLMSGDIARNLMAQDEGFDEAGAQGAVNPGKLPPAALGKVDSD